MIVDQSLASGISSSNKYFKNFEEAKQKRNNYDKDWIGHHNSWKDIFFVKDSVQ